MKIFWPIFRKHGAYILGDENVLNENKPDFGQHRVPSYYSLVQIQ